MSGLLQKELRRWIALAEEQNWRVRRTDKHYAFYPPDGPIIIVAGTSVGGRGTHNARAALRRAGLKGL